MKTFVASSAYMHQTLAGHVMLTLGAIRSTLAVRDHSIGPITALWTKKRVCSGNLFTIFLIIVVPGFLFVLVSGSFFGGLSISGRLTPRRIPGSIVTLLLVVTASRKISDVEG